MKEFLGIKAISFDADGTLWDFEKVMRQSLQKVLDKLTRLYPSAAALLNIEKMIAIRNQVADELKGKVANLEDIRLQAFRRTLIDVGRPNDTLAVHLSQLYLKHRFADIELFPDVLPALMELKKRYRLGMVSNGNSYPERCGLDGIFQFVIFSQDYDFQKPDVRIYRVTLEKAKCAPEELLHVGDSLEKDIQGAQKAGIKCVWLNRKQKKNQTAIKADLEIGNLLQLVDMLV